MDKIIAEGKRKFIGVAELSRRWGLSTSAIYSLKAGTSQLKRHRFGKSIKFAMADVIEFENNLINKKR